MKYTRKKVKKLKKNKWKYTYVYIARHMRRLWPVAKHTSPLEREEAPWQVRKRNCLDYNQNLVMSPGGGSTPRLADWQPILKWFWLWRPRGARCLDHKVKWGCRPHCNQCHCRAIHFTLKMEEAESSDTLISYRRTTRPRLDFYVHSVSVFSDT
jgi:hypothetical protein